MSSARTSTIFTVAAVTVLGGLVAYAVYFDYKRRNDTEFRKKLRTWFTSGLCPRDSLTDVGPTTGKEKKKVTKQTQQAQAQAEAASAVNPAELKATILKIQAEELPATPDEKESYFITQVQVGEQLAQQGTFSIVLDFQRRVVQHMLQDLPSTSRLRRRSSVPCVSTPPLWSTS